MPLTDDQKKKIKDDFIMEHHSFMSDLAHQYYNKNMRQVYGEQGRAEHHPDLVGVAYTGILDALHKYDHHAAVRNAKETGKDPEGNLFLPFARRTIWGHMHQHFKSKDIVPTEVRQKVKEIEASKAKEDVKEEPITQVPQQQQQQQPVDNTSQTKEVAKPASSSTELDPEFKKLLKF